jgi:hypothetical protein
MIMSAEALIKAAQIELSEYGQNGAILVNDTTAITGNFRRIYALENTTFTTLTSNYTKNDATTAAAAADFGTLAAGLSLYGKFTAVTLATGSVILYK